MKSIITLFLALFFYSCFSQELKKVKGELTDITIYTLGALATETGSVQLSKGLNKLVFTDIPKALDNRILLLQLSGNSKVVSISNGVQSEEAWQQDAAYKSILDSIELLENQKYVNSLLISSYQSEKGMLDENRNIGGANNGVINIELQKAMDYYRTRLVEINRLFLNAMKTEKDLSKILIRLQTRKAVMVTNFQGHNNLIYATVSSDNIVNEKFELRYFVNECGWAPFYDVKITDIMTPVVFVYNAKMFNNTGVSWNNVNLTVSTADPSKTAMYPILEKWVLGNVSGYDNVNMKNRQVYDYDYNEVGSHQVSQKPVVKGQTIINATELSIDFAIADKKTIPNDAMPYLVEMKSYSISPSFNYIAIPKLDAQAYLTCGIVDWEQYNFMEGPANVYYGKTFIGESYIAPQLATDTLEVSLGRDSKVMLKYEKKKDYTKKSFLGNTVSQTCSYEITIRNTNTKDISLAVYDQIPISPSSDISVEANEISKADLTKEDGKLTWNVNIKADESVKYIVSYTIKSPKGRPVQITRYRKVRAPSF
jgi:uncharacterized protein (TIGR02231 family)